MLGKTAGAQYMVVGRKGRRPTTVDRTKEQHTTHTTHHTPHTKPSHGRGFQQLRTARGHSLNFCYLVTRAGGLSQDYSLRPRLPKARTNKPPASRPTPVGKLARYSRGNSRRPPRASA